MELVGGLLPLRLRGGLSCWGCTEGMRIVAEILRCRECRGAGAITYVAICAVCHGPGEAGAGCEFCPPADSFGELITVECLVCKGLGTVVECPVCHGAEGNCRRCHGMRYVPGRGRGSWQVPPIRTPS